MQTLEEEKKEYDEVEDVVNEISSDFNLTESFKGIHGIPLIGNFSDNQLLDEQDEVSTPAKSRSDAKAIPFIQIGGPNGDELEVSQEAMAFLDQ